MTDGQREILENFSKSRTAPQREVIRAKALLYAGEGLANTAIAAASRGLAGQCRGLAVPLRRGGRGQARPGAAGPGA